MQAKSELSTEGAPAWAPPVDGSAGDATKVLSVSPSVAAPVPPPVPAPAERWLGLVVPKRHAKRSVTRSLLKRQMRTVMAAHADSLPPGLWVLRLKAPFDRKLFTSPASDPLREAAGDELLKLLQRAAARG